jgi:hypothetical protein
MGFFGNCDNRKLHRLKRECLHLTVPPLLLQADEVIE